MRKEKMRVGLSVGAVVFSVALLGAAQSFAEAQVGQDKGRMEAGHAQGNGGDSCVARVIEIGSRIRAWVGIESPHGPSHLQFRKGETESAYRSKMKQILPVGGDANLAEKPVLVSCVPGPLFLNPAQQQDPVSCINYAGRNEIVCDQDRFGSGKSQAISKEISKDEQYRVVHHEYASLAGFESTRDYHLTNQLTAFMKYEMDIKLAIEPVAKSKAELEFLPVPGKNFEMMKTEVTQLQWYAVMGNNPSYFQKPEHCPGSHSPTNGIVPGFDGFVGCADHPVEGVSAHEADRFAGKLMSHSGASYVYFLPTEQEWEYVARAGSTTVYSFGDDERKLPLYAWFSLNSEDRTHAVATRLPNPWGFYDMHGNVWEWTVSVEGSNRVLRGGSWYSNAGYLRSANRLNIDASSYRSYFLGFRLARTKP